MTHGAQEAIFLFFFSIPRRDDHVIAFKPGWSQSWEVSRLLGAQVTLFPIDPFRGPDLDRVSSSLNSRSKAIFLNFPSNPTAYSPSEDQLSHIIDLANFHGLYVVFDDEYKIALNKSTVSKCERAISVVYRSCMGCQAFDWAFGDPDLIGRMAENKHFTTISNSHYIEAMASRGLAQREFYIVMLTYGSLLRALFCRGPLKRLAPKILLQSPKHRSHGSGWIIKTFRLSTSAIWSFKGRRFC